MTEGHGGDFPALSRPADPWYGLSDNAHYVSLRTERYRDHLPVIPRTPTP